ncbi:hypothetical protein [Limosilactobacillus reuteri]|uniref:hypothetical protein n=1 Tax=Limosilactobacillus reuteri TaxID=1598 RepID=UPI001581C8AA|nr:hypothetical protein [Limosilactobacillus reuteri]QKT16245.1 hypothetical protein DPAN417_10310 [Limosilactobacillus reuteri]
MEILPDSAYVVLDRDMEELIFDTILYSTYEKAMRHINDSLKSGKEFYDHVSKIDETSWQMQDDGCKPRIIELRHNAVW